MQVKQGPASRYVGVGIISTVRKASLGDRKADKAQALQRFGDSRYKPSGVGQAWSVQRAERRQWAEAKPNCCMVWMVDRKSLSMVRREKSMHFFTHHRIKS